MEDNAAVLLRADELEILDADKNSLSWDIEPRPARSET
jgi:hypothetical protein